MMTMAKMLLHRWFFTVAILLHAATTTTTTNTGGAFADAASSSVVQRITLPETSSALCLDGNPAGFFLEKGKRLPVNQKTGTSLSYSCKAEGCVEAKRTVWHVPGQLLVPFAATRRLTVCSFLTTKVHHFTPSTKCVFPIAVETCGVEPRNEAAIGQTFRSWDIALSWQ
mmetsp:Transcript_6274/g.16254  ORF Transcript_6274/g.16254 Transcript_6274/m.16254 type:complete len:169 (+) Transcript_6274:86-592(+)